MVPLTPPCTRDFNAMSREERLEWVWRLTPANLTRGLGERREVRLLGGSGFQALNDLSNVEIEFAVLRNR